MACFVVPSTWQSVQAAVTGPDVLNAVVQLSFSSSAMHQRSAQGSRQAGFCAGTEPESHISEGGTGTTIRIAEWLLARVR